MSIRGDAEFDLTKPGYVPAVRRRRLVTAAIKDGFKGIRGNRYEVRREHIDWAAWSFERYPFGVALIYPETQFLTPRCQTILSVEMFTRMKSDTKERDDDVIGEMLEDLVMVLLYLEQSKDQLGNSVVHNIDAPKSKALEESDPNGRMQGFSAMIMIDF